MGEFWYVPYFKVIFKKEFYLETNVRHLSYYVPSEEMAVALKILPRVTKPDALLVLTF